MIFSIGRGLKKIAQRTFHLKKRETPLSFYQRVKKEHQDACIRPGGKRDFTLFLSKKYRDELLAVVFILFLGGVFMTASATQRSNMPIPYQGRLLDSNYAPKADGTYYFRFLIYDAETAGTCVWSNGTSETHSTNCAAATGASTVMSATVSRGLFTVLLGSGGTLSSTHNPEISSSITNNFNSGTYFLEVRACGTDSSCASPETLSPRKQLAGALFAYNSDYLDGIDSTSFAILAGQSAGQILIGGTGTTDDLTLRTTSGVGTTGADMIFQSGNNGATEAMRILYDGKVGIGTATPNELVELLKSNNGAAAALRITNSYSATSSTDETADIDFYHGTGGGYFTGARIRSFREGDYLTANTQLTGGLSFWTQSSNETPATGWTEKMRITASGNVGIGTATPLSKIDVRGSGGTISALNTSAQSLISGSMSMAASNGYLFGSGAVGTDIVPLLVVSENAFGTGIGGSIGFGGKYATGNGAVTFAGIIGAKENATDGNAAGYLALGTRTTSAYIAEHMRIDSTGNVGIGTTTPQVRFNVVGTSGSANYIASSITNKSTDKGTLFFMSEEEGGFTPFYIERLGSTNASALQTTIYNSGLLQLTTASNKHIALMPGSGGNVGIGATAPDALLSVAGSAHIGTALTHSLSVGLTAPTTTTLNQVFAGMGMFAGQTGATGETDIANNAYYNSGFKYRYTSAAERIGLGSTGSGGDINFDTAPSGTLDTAISWSTKMTILNAGNVGIGTTTPGTDIVGTYDWTAGTALQLEGGDQPALIVRGPVSAQLSLIDTGGAANEKWTQLYNEGGTTRFRLFNDDGTVLNEQVLVIDNTQGNVGIGTTGPGSALVVRSSASSYGMTRIIQTTTNGEASIGYRDDSDSDATSWVVGKNLEGVTNDSFAWYYGGTKLTLLNNGNVGIGTAGPAQLLHVSSGSGSASANRLAGFFLDTSSSTEASNTEYAFIRFATPAYKDGGGTNLEGMELGLSETDGAFYFNTNVNTGITGASIIIDQSTGNVGIGGNSPSAWTANYNAVQLGPTGAGAFMTNNSGGAANYFELAGNNYFDGSVYKYVNTGYATHITVNNGNGVIAFGTAGSGTAGNTATITNQLTIANNGAVTVAALVAGGTYVVCTNTSGILSVGGSASSCDGSDLRLKANIVPLANEMNVFDSLKNLHGVYFNWKTDIEEGKDLKKNRRFGLIAQDVEKVFPELVSTNKNGMKGIEYDKLSAYLIEVAKAQQALLAPLANSITINKDGRVGIGTNTPTATVDIHEKQFADDGIGKQVFGLSSAVSSGDEPNYTVYQGKATTSELAPTATVNRLAVEPDTLYSVEAKIIHRNPLNGNGGSYTLKGVFKTGANSPPVITQASSSVDVLFRDNTAATMIFDVSTNGMLKINVVGNWTEKNVWNSTVFVQTVKN